MNVTLKDLLDAGLHFGHQTKRWNPKMKPFIFGARNGIYIIDLRKTLKALEAAGSEDPQAMACHLRGIEPELLADALADVLLAEDPTPGVAVAEAICYSWRLRWRVIEEWTSAPAPALERLGKLLAGGGERTRVWAATALGRLSSGGAAESVRALAVSGDARDFPVAVLRAHLGDPSGGEALLAQLRNGDEDAMAAAGEAIGMLGAAGAPYLDALRAAMLHSGDRQMLPLLGQAIARIEKALRTAPTELESAPAPAGSGSELEAGPDAAGTELTAGPATPDPAQRGQQRAR